VDDFRAQFSATMAVLASGLPAGAHVFVSSIPNIYIVGGHARKREPQRVRNPVE
jgi:hypothetical protein